jgi:uncharacterized HAD superfamily protein
MRYFVDIDGTICTNTHGEYAAATPLYDNIKKINELYDKGHSIVYWTARGTTSGIDWTDLTVKQLDEWGVKYHELMLGKPYYDLFICDRAINAREYFGDE